MPAWFVRISGVLAFTGAASLSLWVLGLPAGVPLPAPGLVAMAWTVVGLVWLRVVTLWIWWSYDNYHWMPHHWSDAKKSEARPVSLDKGAGKVPRQRPGVLRRLAAYEYESVPWVYLRQAAVWLLMLVSIAALNVLGQSHASQYVRSLVQAGAAYSTATVAEATDVTEIRDDEDQLTGHHATLVLALPDGSRIRSQGAYTENRPKPGDRVQTLWAPTAPELGGVVEEGEPLDRYLDRDWGPTLSGTAIAVFPLILVLILMLPTAIAAEADSLQEQAWSPIAQTVHATAVTGVLLAALPYLSGTFSDGAVPLGLAGVGLLALYIAMPIRALIA
ncbi:hypothetical protein [Streptomyces sp. CB03238]|uniref:hypothetical protein n=1 Tax=Streptomyces sp. CB03238 TaxID=1907777 RepID=UPI000A1045DD|nr:hypothetical protein [Streptomyces sp. CB03238]ORT59386.1 hypothetical protein BKD26_15510 [Streptomyces sp. CB03238]